MTFTLACGDVLPGCTARFESRDRDDLMAQIAGHAASAHNITEITPGVLATIQSKIAVAA